MMQLSPLQSRLAASLAASLLVLVIYILLFAPDLALAAELPLQADILLDRPLDGDVGLQPSYEPEFALFDRGIVGRAQEAGTSLPNNQRNALNLNAGGTTCYVFEKSTIFGDDDINEARGLEVNGDEDLDIDNGPLRRQNESPKTVYISANTCLQPNPLDVKKAGTAPPQLALYISTSSETGCPEPSKDFPQEQMKEFEEGAAMYSINVTGTVYITVAAPNITDEFGGVYNFEIAASIDDYYHRVDTSGIAELLWMDSDSDSALMVSRNLTGNPDETDDIMGQKTLPYSLYVDNDEWPSTNGIRHSACGMGNAVQITANRNGDSNQNHIVETKLTTRGPGNLPKQQFFFEGLNSSSHYSGILVRDANSSNSKREDGVVGGGGIVYAPTTFQTRSTGNCQLIHDLDFCNETQYTTPGDESRFKTDDLAKMYDDYAKKMYSSFEKVMMQIPCEAGSTSRYSLARNCDDCKEAYKRWLCLVTIPRCEDYSYEEGDENGYAVMRNVGAAFPNGTTLPDGLRDELTKNKFNNASRNAWIDKEIQPGPYKEILPCEDICYEVVQSCPAAIGFTCPQPHMSSFEVSYGRRHRNTTTSCNYPGEARTPTGTAGAVLPRMVLLGAVALVVAGILS